MSASALALEYPTAASSIAAVPLLELPVGTTAVLRQVTDTHSRDVLRSLGLGVGARFTVCRLGDPCIIQVGATRIGLSQIVARSMFATVDGGNLP
jgi:Fe2+ transport system protein FeoA